MRGLICLVLLLTGCSGGSSGIAAPTQAPQQPQSGCAATPVSDPDGPPPSVPAKVSAVKPFHVQIIARVSGARELVFLPNGDLLVGTSGSSIAIIPDADGAANAGAP